MTKDPGLFHKKSFMIDTTILSLEKMKCTTGA